MMVAEEADHAQHALQLGHVDIEVQAVDAFHFQGDTFPQNVRNRLCVLIVASPCLIHVLMDICDRLARTLLDNGSIHRLPDLATLEPFSIKPADRNIYTSSV